MPRALDHAPDQLTGSSRVRAFAAGADPNYTSNHRAVAAAALENGNPAIAEAFIAAGLDANLDLAGTLDDGWSLLMLARNAQTARALIAAGADVHYQSPIEHGDTVLTLAAKIHPAEVVAALLEHGADPNRPRGDGCTPLIEAGPRLDIVKVLLEAGAIDVPAYRGQSALDIAIECRSDSLVDLLKQYAKS